MATNVLSPMASPSYEPTMTANNNDNNNPTQAESSNNGSDTSGGGLRRSNTLKAYLANKNKLKERQAMNVIVDPTIIQRGDSSGSDGDLSPLASPDVLPTPTGTSLMSPVSGKRIDTDLDVLDKDKKMIESQLAAVTQRLNQLQSPPTSPITSPTATESDLPPFELPSNLTKEELVEKRTRLCEDLNNLVQKRRELLQSWTRDYKNLKRSGSLAKRQEDLFWVTTA